MATINARAAGFVAADLLAPGLVMGSLASTSQATGVGPTTLMPDPFQALVLGMMTAQHTSGLASGGALGYRTLFTGMAGETGLMAQISLGRAALGTAGLAARGLASMGFGKNVYVQMAQAAPRLGLGGLFGAVDVTDELAKLGAQGLDEAAQLAAAQTFAAKEIADRKFFNVLSGWLGGVPIDKSGAVTFTERFEAGGRTLLAPTLNRKAAEGGYTILAGDAGKFIGRSLKGLGYLELLSIGLDVLAYGASNAYGGLVRTTERLHEQYNPHRLSAGYFSAAAATERQRALMELNSSALIPANQLRGNEAAFYHRG